MVYYSILFESLARVEQFPFNILNSLKGPSHHYDMLNLLISLSSDVTQAEHPTPERRGTSQDLRSFQDTPCSSNALLHLSTIRPASVLSQQMEPHRLTFVWTDPFYAAKYQAQHPRQSPAPRQEWHLQRFTGSYCCSAQHRSPAPARLLQRGEQS